MRYYFTFIIAVLCLCFSALSYANTIQTLPIVDATQLINTNTECWYDNKRYSEGG
jgi:drug/metabolite transporter (DMT)-like permease